MKPRFRQKPDANQPEIVTALLKIGCTVYDASRVGTLPDLVVGYRGVTCLIECKMPNGKLNADQKVWHEGWNGHSVVVHSPQEAIDAVISHVKNHQSR